MVSGAGLFLNNSFKHFGELGSKSECREEQQGRCCIDLSKGHQLGVKEVKV